MKMREIKTAHFVMLCRFAMENDIIDKNYAEFIKLPKFQKKEKRIFSREEISTLWEHTDDLNVQMILIMIYTGFRIGEITSLTVENIHLDDGYIIGGEKTEAGRNRIVPIPLNIPEMQPENLQKIIGHANFQTTANTYIHQDFETLKAEMAKIKK
ncbi:MAG: tyrosine-type recombinase/integrase [Oscillospiraceae bacterium]|nr:tyrosine-type recombinase/integrase [Oscillospiraceae bacterium]